MDGVKIGVTNSQEENEIETPRKEHQVLFATRNDPERAQHQTHQTICVRIQPATHPFRGLFLVQGSHKLAIFVDMVCPLAPRKKEVL